MSKIYVIKDTKMDVDAFSFMQQTDGAAGSYFYNWALLQQHRDFALYTIGEIGYDDNQYSFTSIDRVHICNMPIEDE